MKGRAYERKLRRLAARIVNARVEFTGHVTGAQKAALLQRADIFVSPSKHESYGLTIAEALGAECRVVSHHHYGAEGEVVDCADPKALATVLAKLIDDGRTAKTGRAAMRPRRRLRKMADLADWYCGTSGDQTAIVPSNHTILLAMEWPQNATYSTGKTFLQMP